MNPDGPWNVGSRNLEAPALSRRNFLKWGARSAAGLWLNGYMAPIMHLAGPQQGLAGSSTAGLATLRTRAKQEIARHEFESAISVIDLQTFDHMDVAGDEVRHPGCTINFFALLSVVIDVQQGAYPESDVGDDIAFTIRHSSASRAQKLLLKTGGDDIWDGLYKVNRLIHSLGLRETLFDHPPGYWRTESLNGKRNSTTANEMSTALKALWHHELLQEPWRAYLLEKMTGVKPGLNYLIPPGVPGDSGSRVGHKNGFFWHPYEESWVDNDIGLVWRETEGQQYAYAISCLFQKVPEKYQNIALGQRLSWLTWQALNQLHQPDSP